MTIEEMTTAKNTAERLGNEADAEMWAQRIQDAEDQTMPAPNPNATLEEAIEYLRECDRRAENPDLPMSAEWFQAALHLCREEDERQEAKEWNELDRSTWIQTFDPTDREEVRKMMRQARVVYDQQIGPDNEKITHEQAVRYFNRIKRYWDRVK